MPNTLTTKEFINRAKEVHGSRYNYGGVDYINSQIKVNILCDEHGVFKQTPNNHLSKQGCPQCGKIKRSKSRRKSNKRFIQQSKNIHGNKYSYELTEYVKQGVKVKIICSKHGIFEQLPSNHLRGSGCYKCGIEESARKQSYSNKEYVNNCRDIHDDRYDYSLVEYEGSNEKINIICPEHGTFKQVAYNHLSGQGCPKCVKNYKDNTESFIKKARNVHGDKYDYETVDYKNAHTKVKIKCKKHGYFYQASNNHLKGKGCKKCANEQSCGQWRYTEWIKTAKISNNFDSFKLYIIKCRAGDEEFYKVGRTFLTISKRFKSCSIPYNYKVVSLINGEGRNICEYERILHKNNKNNKYLPKNNFKGMYECFSNINELIL